MPTNDDDAAEPSTKVILKTAAYYVVVIGLGSVVYRSLPPSIMANYSLDSLMGGGLLGGEARATPASGAGNEFGLAASVALSMISAVLFALPMTWIYVLTRAKRGYQQSVVHSFLILPIAVAGVVLLVKHSLALAFSLAGIVAAVRFRNTLEDSKDAVYVFISTAIGLASAVSIPVAAVISVLFNVTVLILWHTDFASAPVELDGRIAKRRLQRAKSLSRTGTFVARIDEEVFKNMTREQLEGVAKRALRRARDDVPEGGDSTPGQVVRIRTRDIRSLREAVEPSLADCSKHWHSRAISTEPDGIHVMEYVVTLNKKTDPDELLSLILAAGGSALIGAELA